jgi:hypothetical protein
VTAVIQETMDTLNVQYSNPRHPKNVSYLSTKFKNAQIVLAKGIPTKTVEQKGSVGYAKVSITLCYMFWFRIRTKL